MYTAENSIYRSSTINRLAYHSDIFRIPKVICIAYRLPRYSLIALIVFRSGKNIPLPHRKTVRSSFRTVHDTLLHNVEVVAEIVFVVTSTYAV